MENEKFLKLNDGRFVYKDDYISVKTKDLIEFGYSTLTEKEVEIQVDKILAKEIDLSIIGMLCQDDLEIPKD